MHTDQIHHASSQGGIPAMLPLHPALDGPERRTGEGDAYSNALSIVAHDLRGPLANLGLLVEEIARSAADGRRAHIARKAERADRIIDRMAQMLSAVLERARNGRDPLSGKMAAVNLAEVLNQAFAINEPAAQRKSIAFRCLAIEPLIVMGDPELLMEAFDNLIGNAVRHSPEGGTITCEICPADGDGIQVRIGDEGPGFSAQDLQQAFRPFGSSRTARPGSSKGSSGLGLWIARLIAERHGGTISIRNRTNGTGALLSVCLPALPA